MIWITDIIVNIEPTNYGETHELYITMGEFRLGMRFHTPHAKFGCLMDEERKKMFAEAIPLFLQEWCRWKSEKDRGYTS